MPRQRDGRRESEEGGAEATTPRARRAGSGHPRQREAGGGDHGAGRAAGDLGAAGSEMEIRGGGGTEGVTDTDTVTWGREEVGEVAAASGACEGGGGEK